MGKAHSMGKLYFICIIPNVLFPFCKNYVLNRFMILKWNGFVGIVDWCRELFIHEEFPAWWLIWLVDEEMKFGMEFYIHYNNDLSLLLKEETFILSFSGTACKNNSTRENLFCQSRKMKILFRLKSKRLLWPEAFC